MLELSASDYIPVGVLRASKFACGYTEKETQKERAPTKIECELAKENSLGPVLMFTTAALSKAPNPPSVWAQNAKPGPSESFGMLRA